MLDARGERREMNKKISVLFVTLLMMILSVIVIFPENLEVEATGGDGGGDGEDNGIGLDYDYMWDVIYNLSRVVHDAYDEGDIRKGRAFGTKGEHYTVEYILQPRMENLSLENVDKLPLGYVDRLGHRFKQYSSKMITEDFQLIVNNASCNPYNWSQYVPKTESFPIPSGFKHYNASLPKNERLNYNYTFDQELIRKFVINPENYPYAGTLTNYFYNLTFDELADSSLIIGYVQYLSNNETVPEEQDGKVFLINDEQGCQKQLDNMTNNSGCVIICEAGREVQNANILNCTFPIIKVSDDTGNQQNLTNITSKLENGTGMIADNVLEDEILTFTYNLSEACLPSDFDWVFIGKIRDPHETEHQYVDYGNMKIQSYIWHAYNWHILDRELIRPICKGIIYYDFTNTHFMSFASRSWKWNQHLKEGGYRNGPALPMFSVNNSVGSWLEENRYTTTISGYLDQEWKKQTSTSPGIEAYNVVGYRNISNNPEDKTVIISNRYDGWWGETPSDSGVGAAIVLGIAKYFTDYNIKPKCNLTFLFTTGEEYGYRGSYHFKDSHPNNDYRNYTLFITLDQLAFKQNDTYLMVSYNNEPLERIVNISKNDTNYSGKTGYGIDVNTSGIGGTDAGAWMEDSIDIIAFHKRGPWTGYHRSGMNYAEGDSLKNTDRNDANVTFELAWNITKYFTVDPDCWIENTDIDVIDTDDDDDLVDTVTVYFNVTSILPHDLAMVNSSLLHPVGYPPVIKTFETMNFTVNRSLTSKSVSLTLSSGESPSYYQFRNELYNSTGRINEIINPSGNNANQTEYSDFIFLYPYGYNLNPPNITNVSATPDPVGYGFNVTINADVFSNTSDIDMVTFNVSYPDDSWANYTMTNIMGDTYEYVFNDTWQHGQYNNGIWAKDSNGNESGSSQYSFNVSAMATVSVCTILDEYGNNTLVNVTDPPSNPALIGYELLDGDKVLRIWNRFDSYYFNTSNGIQFTNHYNEYWSHNVLMLGYYNNDVWNLIYRTDELSGFNKDIDSDEETYVNATLWKDLSYEGYEFRLAIRYHLGDDDNELTIIPYIKNLGDENIPYNLGFAWEINNIQIDMTPENDYIEINGTWYYLNESLDETYNNIDPPSYYIREDISSDKSESLYLRWDENLNYVVSVKSRDGQYNAPVILGIKIGTLDIGQEKHTELFWHDASEVVYYFDDVYYGEVWAVNPSYMVDNITSNYANTAIISDVELCINNTCYGEYLGLITKIEIRAYGYWSGLSQRDIILRPVFDEGDGNNHVFMPPRDVGDWSQWFEITYDKPTVWDWSDVRALDCDVESGYSMLSSTVYCSKVEIRVTYTTNSAPIMYNPVPSSGSTGVGIQPVLSINVSDVDGDNMNITWLSNSSGSWQVFGTNLSVSDGTYHQTMSNASVNGQWWYWKVNVSDGLNYTESSVYKFYTGYESKITNTGSTNIRGYLLIQVQYYNTSNSTWVVADDTVNETNPRTILWANPTGIPGQHILSLDTIFNGKVNTVDLITVHGTGTYRVYACFRDPDGDVLVCDDESLMEDTYEFTVSES